MTQVEHANLTSSYRIMYVLTVITTPDTSKKIVTYEENINMNIN